MKMGTMKSDRGAYITVKVDGRELTKRRSRERLCCCMNYQFRLPKHQISGTDTKDGDEVFFRIKRSTQLKKLMNAYCDQQSVDINRIFFIFDGRRLQGLQTPDELEMEDGDMICALFHLRGGTTI